MEDGLRRQNLDFLTIHDMVVIVENLPVDLPVLEAELDVLETYLGDIVDGILTKIECEGKTAHGCLRTMG